MRLVDIISRPHRTHLDPDRLKHLRRAVSAQCGIAVAYEPRTGWVLVGGEHRLAALAARGDRETTVYVLRTWRDLVAWLIRDREQGELLGSTPWTPVSAAYLHDKAVQLFRPAREEKPAEDIAEYAGINRSALDNTRWVIVLADEAAEDPRIRQYAAEQRRLIDRGEAGAHSVRDRVKQLRDHLAAADAPQMSAVKQREMLNDTIAKLSGMIAGLDTLGELNPELSQVERDDFAARIGKINTRFIRLRTKLKG